MCPRGVLWPQISKIGYAVAFIRSAIRTIIVGDQYAASETPSDQRTAFLGTNPSRIFYQTTTDDT